MGRGEKEGEKRGGGRFSLVHINLPSYSKSAMKVRKKGIRDLSSQVTIPIKYFNCFLLPVKLSIFIEKRMENFTG